MSLLFLPYLSQILTELLEILISLQGIKISIHVCNASEVILFLFGTINFTTKDRSQLVWTGFFHVVDWLGLVFKGPVAVPEYLKQSRPVVVASFLVLRKKPDLTGLENTSHQSQLQLWFQLEKIKLTSVLNTYSTNTKSAMYTSTSLNTRKIYYPKEPHPNSIKIHQCLSSAPPSECPINHNKFKGKRHTKKNISILSPCLAGFSSTLIIIA